MVVCKSESVSKFDLVSEFKIDVIKWLIEPWFGAHTICGGLNIDAIKWLIELWFSALRV